MNKKERAIIEEIIFITEDNPAGYLDENDFDENDDAPKDAAAFSFSLIRKRCLELLK